MAKTTQNDIKIDIIGFFRELAESVEKEENVTLDPRLLKSLKYIEKEYEIPYDQRNTKKSSQRGRNKSIVETVETDKTIKAKTANVEEVAKDTEKGEATQQEIEK